VTEKIVNDSIAVKVPGVDFAEMARQAIAGQLTAAMVKSDSMVQDIVATALTHKVDSNGSPGRGYSGDTPYIEWICRDLIAKVTKELIAERVEAMRPVIRKQLEKTIAKSVPALAEAFTESFIASTKQHHYLKVDVSFKGASTNREF
jgi:hypothetical protein